MVPGKARKEAALQPLYLVLAGQSRSGKLKRLFRATWAKYLSSRRNVEADSMERTLELHMPRWHETRAQCRQAFMCQVNTSTLPEHTWVRGAAQDTGTWVGAYLLSNQEPTLDEPVQHFLTVAVGRLAGL